MTVVDVPDVPVIHDWRPQPARTEAGTTQRSGSESLDPVPWQKAILVGLIIRPVRRLRINSVEIAASFLDSRRLVGARIETQSLDQHPARGHWWRHASTECAPVSLALVRPNR